MDLKYVFKDSHDVIVVAFSAAAQLGCTDMVRMLLDLGVPVNATDARGWTALHAASAAGHEDVMLLLLQSGVRTLRTRLCHGQFTSCNRMMRI